MSKVLTLIVASLLVGSCQRDGGVIGKARLPGIEGTFIIEDDLRTTPLTAARHSIFYVRDNDRMLVFQGRGGSKPQLSLLGERTVLIAYCGGIVEKTEAFLDGDPLSGRDVHAWRIQPVNSVGLSLNGKAIC